MPLTFETIKEALKTPKQKAIINRAVLHEERLRFHSELALDRWRTSPYYNSFLRDVETRLPPDKFRTFLSLFKFPVKTVQDVDQIFDQLSKVHDGQNPVYKYDFISSDYADDWNEFSKDDAMRWRTEGMDALRLSVNSIVICDLPTEQTGPLPEPYFYFLDISHVIDFQSDGKDIDWLVFRKNENEVIAIDDESYWIIGHKANEAVEKATFINQIKHDLTYCPAKWFWADSVSPRDPFIKQSPLSTHLDELDWLLFYLISKRVADLYATYPIVWSYEYQCDYQHEDETGYFVRCDHGHLRDKKNVFIITQDGSLLPCPACGDKTLTGAGSKISVPIPTGDNVDMRPPAGFINSEVTNLEFIVSEIKRLQSTLQSDITGYAPDPINDKAINEKQVTSMIEEPTAKLRNLKKNFEIIRQWTDYTKAKLRYGDRFIDCSCDMGTDFYLYDANLFLDLYTNARKSQLGDTILDTLLDQHYATKYRNNPDEYMEFLIKKNIHPAWHLTEQQAITFYEKGIISQEDLVIILKFSTFVTKFKREQASLIDFGRALPFKSRIERIKQIFDKYARDATTIGTRYVPTQTPNSQQGAAAEA